MNENRKMSVWAWVASFPLAYFWVWLFVNPLFSGKGTFWLFPLFTAAYFAWVELALHQKSAKSREHWFWAACTMLIAVSVAAHRGNAVQGFQVFVIHVFAAYYVYCRGGILSDGMTSEWLPWDLAEMSCVPMLRIFNRLRDFWVAVYRRFADRAASAEASGKRWKSLLLTLLVVAIALPVFFGAANLLSAADETFAEVWKSVGDLLTWEVALPESAVEFLLRLVLSLPVGAFLYGLVSAALTRDASILPAKEGRETVARLRFAPVSAGYVVLGGFIGLYLLFFGTQAKVLLGAFQGVVPGKLTASEYARSGFFQLCQVMAINFGVLLGAAKLSRVPLRENRILRGMSCALMVESILLAVTAASKLWLYIDRFGFTPLRYTSMWGIIVLTAGCVLAIASLHKPCHPFRKWVWFAAATFTALCFF